MSPKTRAPLTLGVVALVCAGVYVAGSRPRQAPTAATAPVTSAPSASASAAPTGVPFPTLDPKTPEQLREIATFTRTAKPDDATELRRAIQASEHPVVVGSSLIALARLGALEIDEDFERLLDDPRRRVRNDAIVALGMSGNPKSVGLLAKRLDPEEPQDRAVALGALRRIGSEEARALISEALDDPRATDLDRKMAGAPPKER